MVQLALVRTIAKNIISSPERVFVILALLFGGAFMIAVPPFQTPDEATHVLRAYEVASLRMPERNNEGMAGNDLPASILETQRAVSGDFRPGELQAAGYHPRQVKYALTIPLGASDKLFYSTSGTPAYFPASYLPHAVVTGLLNLFNSPVILTLYFLRLMNLVIWILLIYFSIRLFPVKKWAVAGVALIPMLVAQSVSVGLDAIYIGLFAVYIAIVIRAWIDVDYFINKRTLIVLLLAAITMAMAKPVAIALFPIIFIVSNKKFKTRSPVYAKLIISVIPIALYVLWGVLSQSASQITTIGAEAVSDPSSQINMLFSNPADFVMDFTRTMLVRSVESFILVTSMIGNFGMLDAPLSLVSVVFGYMLLMFMFLYGYKEEVRIKVMKSQASRLVLVSSLAVYVFGVFASMYIFYSLPEHNIIRGVNGRYLIPMLFLLIPLIYTRTPIIREKSYASVVTICVFMLFLSSLTTLFYRYYTI